MSSARDADNNGMSPFQAPEPQVGALDPPERQPAVETAIQAGGE